MKNYPSLLIVTPAKNESKNIQRLSEMLAHQKVQNFTWVIVIDGKDDESIGIARSLKPSFPYNVLNFESSGLLIKGGAFQTWSFGVDFGINEYPQSEYVMKLDADVILDSNYFAELFAAIQLSPADILGGVITGNDREQSEYVPGPVKMYSREALTLVKKLPIATGFDVMDEMICRQNGLKILVVKSAKFRMIRSIGHSQGKLHGRYRNGLVCRWTGYSFYYFILHAVRYFFRSPYILGSLWMVVGYLFAGPGPYNSELRAFHRKLQKARLLRIFRSPIATLRDLYGS